MLEVSKIPQLPSKSPLLKTRPKSELIRNNSSIIPDGKFSSSSNLDGSMGITVELPKDVKNILQVYCQIHSLKTNIDFFLQKSDEEFGSLIFGIHGANSSTYIHQEDQVVEWINNLDCSEVNNATTANEAHLSTCITDLINVENNILNTVEEVEELICAQLKQHTFYQQFPNDFKKYLKLYTQNLCIMDQDPQTWTPVQCTKLSYHSLKELFTRFAKRRQRIEKITLQLKNMISDLPKSDKNANDLLSNSKSSAQSIYFDQNLPSAADLCTILKLDIRKTYHQDQRLLDFRFQLKQFHSIIMKQLKRHVRLCDQFKTLGQLFK